MLQMKAVAINKNDTVIFPEVNISMHSNSIVAIHSDVTIREVLMELLTGKLTNYSGEILINKQLISKKMNDMVHLFRLEEQFYDRLTVKETLHFMLKMTDKQIAINDLVKKVKLEVNLNVKIYQLTYSEKKRLQLAIILLFNGPIFIFEEPDHNIDIESRIILVEIMNELKERDKVVCILTANMESAISFSDTVYRLTEDGLHEVALEDEEEMNENVNEPPTTLAKPIRLEKIPTKIDDKIVLFDPLEIDYIESYEGIAHLYINGDSYPTTTTLQELEAKLIPFGFFRCHRSYIINLQKVREVITWTRNSYSLTLDDKGKTTIPLSKAKLSELKEMLGL